MVVACLGLAPSALAHDHRLPPAAVLMVGELRQRGTLSEERWVTSDSTDDEVLCRTDFGSFLNHFSKTSLTVPADTVDAAIRVRKSAAPRSVVVQAWEKVDRRRRPTGQATPIPSVLTPHIVGDKPAAWNVAFALPRSRHVYLQIDLSWTDEEGCGGGLDTGSQHAGWRFHVKRARADDLPLRLRRGTLCT